MKGSLAGSSMLLLGVSVALWILLTVFESTLAGMSLGTERIFTFLLLVLPSGIGAVLGVMSFMRKEGNTWLAMVGTVLNSLFSLFHLMIVLFAG